MKNVEIFLNFPMLAIHRNVPRRDPTTITERSTVRMTRFWGDESWNNVGYRSEPTLFGATEEKVEGRELAEAFRERLKRGAGFSYVPAPMAMRNSVRAAVYYLFFASYNEIGGKIVTEIFNKFRRKGYR